MTVALPARQRPEIILVAYDAPPTVGGIQTHFAGLVQGLVEHGRRVLAIAPRVDGCEEFDRDFVCPLQRIGDLRKGVFALAAARHLRRLARELPPPEMVIALNALPAGLAYPLAGVRRWAPFGVTGYSTEFLPQSGSWVRGLALRWVVSSADACFAVSNYTADNFRRMGVADERIAVVFTGIGPKRLVGRAVRPAQMRARLGIGCGRPMLLTVARLVARKGHDVVLRALRLVARSVPDAVYVIAGDGPTRPTLERLARDLGVADRTVFAGRVADEDLASLYAACDVFVMVPRELPGEMPEGFGIVYLEAAVFGKPSVGSRCGGVVDAIVHGRTGLLVQPDDPEATARAITQLLLDPARAAEMGREAKRRALAEFTWKAVAQRHLEAIARVRQRRAGQR